MIFFSGLILITIINFNVKVNVKITAGKREILDNKMKKGRNLFSYYNEKCCSV